MFSCNNCGECCGPVVFPKDLYEKYKDKILREVTIEDFGRTVIPKTVDLTCPFLDSNNLCVIYDERPAVCRLYGTTNELPCPHYNCDGQLRSEKSKERTLAKINEQFERARRAAMDRK